MAEAEQVSPASTAQQVDFTNTIDRLQKRAFNARVSMLVVGIATMLGVLLSSGFLIQKVAPGTNISTALYKQPYTGAFADLFSVGPTRVSTALSARASRLVRLLDRDDFGLTAPDGTKVPPKRTPPEIAATKQQLAETLGELDRAVQIESKVPQDVGVWQGVLSTLVLSAGAVGLLLLLVQIAVGFMRYYARMAETYDAQADAFLASGGSPQLAAEFLRHLHVDVDLGTAPTTLYEKALDTIREAIASKKS